MKRLKCFTTRLIVICMLICLCWNSGTICLHAKEEGQKKESSKSDEKNVGDEDAQPVESIDISSPSAILMEKTTGTILFEKESDIRRPPASVTKIMTLLLIFDALERGNIHLDDEVSTSELAASMGGSQVFLEPGETQTVDTLMKCIAVASANDACVAMAEHLCGSVDAFVENMNKRAKGLGMENTHFVNCNGLDEEGHETTAHDIAIMSREMITKYPQIRDYSTIWMENITHNTKKGSSEFGLTNTNKLIRQYEYATGLKTGSTGNAKFCVSATAEKNGIELIAVIMGAESSKIRFSDAVKLLNYGFSKCSLYQDTKPLKNKSISVQNGKKKNIKIEKEKDFAYLLTDVGSVKDIEKKIQLKKNLKAPVKKGEPVGKICYFLGEKEIGSVKILALEENPKCKYADHLKRVFEKYMKACFVKQAKGL